MTRANAATCFVCTRAQTPVVPFRYEYPRPMVTVDVALFAPAATAAAGLRVLLIQRARAPFAGTWALPGGFLDMDEELADAARRELREETSIKVARLMPLGTYGKVGRDPRGRTISVVYLAAGDADRLRPRAGDDAGEVAWHPVAALPRLAFDHRQIVRDGVERLREAARRPTALVRALFGTRPGPAAGRLVRALRHE
ncbi:MAG: NUDIX hydrolase [Planctomycetota bacterium]